MGRGLKANVHIFENFAKANQAIADQVAALADQALDARGRFSLVLAGGSTPRQLYELLASDYHSAIDWSRVDMFWGDERFVPLDDDLSNFRMAREAMLDHLPVPSSNVYPMPTACGNPEDAASGYEKELRSYWTGRNPGFDLALLGIGSDGHTASLFPGSNAITEEDRWVLASRTSAKPPVRLTLTYPILNASRHVFILASGSSKAEAVRCAISTPAQPNVCPASGINPDPGRLDWWLDADAALLID